MKCKRGPIVPTTGCFHSQIGWFMTWHDYHGAKSCQLQTGMIAGQSAVCLYGYRLPLPGLFLLPTCFLIGSDSYRENPGGQHRGGPSWGTKCQMPVTDKTTWLNTVVERKTVQSSELCHLAALHGPKMLEKNHAVCKHILGTDVQIRLLKTLWQQ